MAGPGLRTHKRISMIPIRKKGGSTVQRVQSSVNSFGGKRGGWRRNLAAGIINAQRSGSMLT